MDQIVDYDACYAALELPPGSPLTAIRKARNRLAKLLHRDLNPHMSDEPLKVVLSAFASLEAYWNENGHPPPTGRASEPQRRPEPEEAWPGPQPREEWRPPPPPPNPPLVVPRVAKSLPHDLIDFAESLSWGWTGLCCVGVFVLLVACGMVGQALVSLGVIDEVAMPDLRAATVFFLFGLGLYLLGYGPYAFHQLHKLDMERQERWTKEPAERFPALMSQALVNYRVIKAQWSVLAPVFLPEDRSTLVKATVAFEHRLLWLFPSKFEVVLFLKFKKGAGGTRYAFWFERRSTGVWWPPVLGMSRLIAGNLKRMLEPDTRP